MNESYTPPHGAPSAVTPVSAPLNSAFSPERALMLLAELDAIKRERGEITHENEYLREALESCKRELDVSKKRNIQLMEEIQKLQMKAAESFAKSSASAPVSTPVNLPPANNFIDPRMVPHPSMSTHTDFYPPPMFSHGYPVLPQHPYPAANGMNSYPAPTPASPFMDAHSAAEKRKQRLAELELLMDEEARNNSDNSEIPVKLLPRQSFDKSSSFEHPQLHGRNSNRGLDGEYVHYFDSPNGEEAH